MDKPYEPIACELHEEYLAQASLRRECELTVKQADGAAATVRGVIADVYTRDKAEYLQLKDGQTFRLDQILTMNGKPMA